MKFVFVRTPKPRRFVHRNIYYDPEKEEREEREARIDKELGLNKDKPFVTSIRRGSFRRNQIDDGTSSSITKNERRASNIRFLVIVFILILVAIFLYSTSGSFLAL